MTFLRMIPSWVWMALTIALVILGIGKAVESYLDMSKELATTKQDLSNLVITNGNLAANNRELMQDVRTREKIRQTIEVKTQESDKQFEDLDSKLQAAILERDALEAATAATEALQDETPVTVTDTVKPTPKPTVKPVVQPVKKPAEIGILWEAYCLDASSPKCTQAK